MKEKPTSKPSARAHPPRKDVAVELRLSLAEAKALLVVVEEGAEALLTGPWAHVAGYFTGPAQRKSAERVSAKLAAAVRNAERAAEDSRKGPVSQP